MSDDSRPAGAKCNTCGYEFSVVEAKALAAGARSPCPKCRSTGVTFDQQMTATVTPTATLQMKADLYVDVLKEMPEQGRWRRRWVPTASIMGALVILAAGAYAGQALSALSAAGLVFDIGGAGVFATGLVLSPRAVKEMGTPRWDGNEIPRIYWHEVQLDLRVGLALLVLGFAAQAIADAWRSP